MVQTNIYKKTILSIVIVIFLVSISAIVGWVFNIESLTEVISGLPSMKFNTAISFLLLSLIIYCIQQKKSTTLVYVLNTLLFLICSLTLFQDISGVDLKIDQLFIADNKGEMLGKPTPGRMSMATSLSFILLSLSLFSIVGKNQTFKKIAAYLPHVVTFFAFLAIIGYFFEISTIDKITFISSMAIHTAIGFLIASIAISLIFPYYGITELFTGRKIGNMVMRKLFFKLTFITLAISYLILLCFRKGYFAPDFSITILGVSFIAIALLILILVVHSMNELEEDRTKIEEELHITSTYLNATPDPIIIVDRNLKIHLSNSLMEKVFGYSESDLAGENISVLIHEDDHEKHSLHIENYIKQQKNKNHNISETGKPNHTSMIELKALRKNGNEAPVEMTLNTIWTKNGVITLVAFRDISRRILAEEQFKAAKEKVLTALDASIIGIWDLDVVNSKIEWDETMYKLYGVHSEDTEISLDLWKETLHPDDVDRVLNLFNDALANKATYDTFFRIIWPDKSIHYIRAKGSLHRNSKNEPIRMSGTNWDITAQKESQLALENSIKQNKLFIEEAPSAIAMFDNNMIYQAASKKWLEDYGITENIIGKSHYEIFPDIEKKWKKIHQKCLQGAIDTCDEALYEKADGTKQWITWKIKPWYKKEDEIGGLLMYTANITQFKVNILERLRLQDMLNQSNEVAKIGSWEYDREKDDMTWSDITKKIHEVPENYVPTRNNSFKFYQKEDTEKLRIATDNTLEKGIPFDLELRFVTAKSNKKWVRIVGRTKSFDKNTRVYGIVQDISTIKAYEASLIVAKQKAEKANRSKSEFLANMSHEIRTPLNGIIGFTDLLMKTNLSDSQEKYMHTVYNSANHLLDIINDILDFSKIEAGKLELNIEKVDLLELCSQTIDIIKHQAHEKKLEVLLDISTTIDRFIYTDPVRLRQILTNLLGNAVKFTHQGEVELEVRCVPDPLDSEKKKYLFSIRDTGVGIAASNLAKVFKAFDQEDASTTRKYGGTGLGLTISNRLLEFMDSKLEVKSKLGQGSTFSFAIDFKTEKGEYENILTEYETVHKVLIVDDNDNNRTILKEMLRVNNITYAAASNGVEALEILEDKNDFNLLIIDFNMPYLNGIEVIDHIRNSFKIDSDQLPIMLLHSSVDDEFLNKACKELKVQFNITKPILFHQLYNVINRIEKPNKAEEVAVTSNEMLLEDIAPSILIAEDNPVNKLLARTLMQRILPKSTVIEADNGKEAVALFTENKVDLIFMDIQMPIMSGFEATKEIRAIEKGKSRVPIIALTARSMKGEKDRCIKHGMDEYVLKPVVFNTIKRVLIDYLKK
ncbi:response regulator [Joostella atrarenae]|uniref:histidine kinase n=1 Tax=Joostella atrarenae TaxID=679257 RepID=A0ABS9IZB2_9FLAO|nr:PAS domain-containing hybrid sensor histidine kinase/response regulator [Joostella atrarenae]MCF8713443.1 response regulator [Joostella atrarenae]